jgi:molybdopterin-guanine dinucleotide biosynthesis protein A
MGQDKAFVMVDDHTMLERVALAIGQVTDRVVVLGADRPGWECWPDAVHVGGPLAGIATALARSDRAQVLAVAVDHPFVSPVTLGCLLEKGNGLPVVPVDDHGVRQVTCALYPKSIADLAVEEAGASGSIQSLLDRVYFVAVPPGDWGAWGEDGRSWFSVDSPELLAIGLANYGA